METLLEVGLSNAAMAAALAVIATLAGLVCRRPALVHALWLLVLLKLVTPPLVSFSVRPAPRPVEAVETTPGKEIAQARMEPESANEPEMPPAADEVWPEAAAAEPVLEEVPAAEERAEFRLADLPTPPGGWLQVLAWVWLIGSGCWFVLALGRVGRFSRALRQARAAPALQKRVNALARRVGLSRCPALLLVPGRLAPMIWGVRAPVLLVPEGLEKLVGNSGLETLLLHELAHVRRRDHLVRLLEFVVLGLFWWNPIAWYARRELREVEEQCCDAWVVRTLPGTGRTYATALVDALDFLCGSRPALPPLASGLGEVADLKRRLKMILTGKTPHGLGRSNGLFVLGLALFLLPLVPVWGRAQDTTDGKIVINERNLDIVVADESDLKKLEADVQKKAAELAELKAKMEQIRKAAVDSAKRKLTLKLDELKGLAAMQRSAGPVIRIEIGGLNMKSDELQELVKKLEAVLPGKEKRVVIIAGKDQRVGVGVGAGMGGAYLYRFARPGDTAKTPMGGGSAAAPKPAAPGAGARFPVPATPGRRGATDQRIDSLEKKLDLLLRELEALRKDMRKGGPRGGAGGAGGPGGGIDGGVFGSPPKP
jgi:beta-lactamase regulating signal transducer with metallopeptidase domain